MNVTFREFQTVVLCLWCIDFNNVIINRSVFLHQIVCSDFTLGLPWSGTWYKDGIYEKL